ncbi:efflux RND transporter periplasmic adaptor subunit [Achromobacter sp. GG226]|nr:efflux RND transporter periplasmic adaptor subunit [Verticiella sp. GG226]
MDDSRLVSPIDGVLARLNIEQGRYFSPQAVDSSSEQGALRTVPALVIDPSRFEIRADLPSYAFQDIQAGARAQVGGQPPRDGDAMDPETMKDVIAGTVHAVSPSLDPETRTFEVIVHTTSEAPRLQDGAFVALWIARPAQAAVLTVPLDAVRHRNDQSFVFVVDTERGVVAERRVMLGQQAGDRRAVLSGLEPGDAVVTDGRARLTDGQRVRVITSGEGA